MDIQSSKNILLLGAGFTKNFGGLLANEMWAEIFNHEKIQNQPRLRTLMLNDFDYESVFYSVLEGFEDAKGLLGDKNELILFETEEKNAMMKATTSAYHYIDEILREYVKNRPHPTELDYFNELICQIGSQNIIRNPIVNESGETTYAFQDTGSKNFIFTLNQDLFFERLSRKDRYANISIPGIDNNSKWFTTFFNEPLEASDFCKLPTEDELNGRNILDEGNYFLIKLHGSCNWFSFDDSEMMVIGRGKESKIQKEPLLKEYFEIFDAVISRGAGRLLIIGYGFGDAHINEIISKAVDEHGLKIYILSPEKPEALRKMLCENDDTKNIWEAISGHFQFVGEVLIKNDYFKETTKNHFHDTFFGERF
ncbi:SIR2 family protein [Methanolobus mangrovi]|uniref:SIR2 family protein n=1 Tax=Methanolobus mangrovi TaxID=3072977 RepID=A0AA51UGD1_9EURY|nr:SIR2 family protein [Methanolobus mangrovi]WMW22419.1 SIR2 family protein [Methanolobus mangrovi]